MAKKRKTKKKTQTNPCSYCKKPIKGNKGLLKVHMNKCKERPAEKQIAEKTQMDKINALQERHSGIQIENVEIKDIPSELKQTDEKGIPETTPSTPAEQNVTIPEETVKHFLKVGGNMLSKMRKNDVWKFEDDELNAITPLTKSVVDKYIPNFQFSDEAMLAITFGMIMIGKYQVDVIEKRRKEENKEENKVEEKKTEKSHPLQTKENAERAEETKESFYGNQSKEKKEDKENSAWLKNLKGNRS